MTRTPRTSRRTRLASAAVLAPLALGLAACGGGDDDADDRAEQPAATVTVTEGASDAPADDTTDDTTTDDTTTDDGSTGDAGGSGDLETAAQAALGAVSGATLFSLDRDAQGFDATLVTDDGVEQDVEIAADGTTITRGPTEDVDSDADDAAERERLLGVSLDYAAAIEAAGAQAQGTVTGVGLGEDNGTAVWEVQFDEDTPTETTVDVDAESGEILRVEQDD